MENTVAVLGTFDTKGDEYLFLIEKLRLFGIKVITIDVSTNKSPLFVPDYLASDELDSSGNIKPNRAKCMEKISQVAYEIITSLIEAGRVQGVISMGGGQGTYLAASVLRRLPIGFPKLLVSTIAFVESSASQFKHINDTMVINSLVDIAGLNSVLESLITMAAGAIAGMLDASEGCRWVSGNKKAIAISAWGVTTPCAVQTGKYLKEDGYEVYTFHSSSDGGYLFEQLRCR